MKIDTVPCLTAVVSLCPDSVASAAAREVSSSKPAGPSQRTRRRAGGGAPNVTRATPPETMHSGSEASAGHLAPAAVPLRSQRSEAPAATAQYGDDGSGAPLAAASSSPGKARYIDFHPLVR